MRETEEWREGWGCQRGRDGEGRRKGQRGVGQSEVEMLREWR